MNELEEEQYNFYKNILDFRCEATINHDQAKEKFLNICSMDLIGPNNYAGIRKLLIKRKNQEDLNLDLDPEKLNTEQLIFWLDLYVSKKIFNNKSSTEKHLASNFNCLPYQTKEKYSEELINKKVSLRDCMDIIQNYSRSKLEESSITGLDIENTPSAILEEWIIDFIRNKRYKERNRTKDEIIADLANENYEFKMVSETGDMLRIASYLGSHKEIKDSFYFEMNIEPGIHYRNRGERLKAVNLYDDAISLLNKAIELLSDDYPFLLVERAECNFYNNNLNIAHAEISEAIELIELENSKDEITWPWNYDSDLYRCYKLRAKIREQMNDLEGSESDLFMTEIYDTEPDNEDD